MTSPTARSLAYLRSKGYSAQVVERYNAYSRRRVDLFGCMDIVSMSSMSIAGIQATSASNAATRCAKSAAEPRLALWLSAGGVFEVWGWAKRGPRGKRKLWTLARYRARMQGGAVVFDRISAE